jgi:hypothetical protein
MLKACPLECLARLQDQHSGSDSRFPGQNEFTALPDLGRILTQVAAKGRSRGGATPGCFHVRSFAILLRSFCPSRRSLGIACVFEHFCRLVQRLSPGPP